MQDTDISIVKYSPLTGRPVQRRTPIADQERIFSHMNGRRCDLVLSGVTLPQGRVADLSIRDGLVRHVGSPLPADRTVQCGDFRVLPGAVDMHVHMRGGVQSYKEDWESGSQSAIAGGVTVVVDQPNSIPPIISAESFRSRVREARQASRTGFAINGGVEDKNDLQGIWQEGAMAFGEIFAAPSSYAEALSSDLFPLMLRRIGELGALATLHAEEVKPGVPSDLEGHDRLRDLSGESRMVGDIAKEFRHLCRLHFCHLSTAGAVAAARNASVEVAPHHLFLSIENGDGDNAFLKVNPPIRHEQVRKELWKAWSRIDVIASDHAPHTRCEKEQGFADAPSGIPGVETMLPLLMAAFRERKITLMSIIKKTSWTPADLLGIPRAGFRPGMRADFALYGDQPTLITAEDLHSRAGWTPYEGMPGLFPERVIRDGALVYDGGEFSSRPPRWYAGRGYQVRELI
jgi:dihydroorotase